MTQRSPSVNFIAELKRRNVIRVALFYIVSAWLVLQVAETVLPLFEVPDSMLRGLVILLALGFVPALVIAWVFEWTPDGIRLESEARQPAEIERRSPNKLNWATLVIALLAIGFLVVDRTLLESPPAAPAAVPSPAATVDASGAAPSVRSASIAVLPFADLSPAGDQEYFSDGIAEEILNALTRVEGLDVASRTSAFQFKGREIGIPEIATTLRVRHVLEGSVRKAGDSLRITAQLIDASNDRHLWSQTFDRPLTAENVFAIQDEIATAIVAALVDSLGIRIGGQPRLALATANLGAYDLYLRARALFQARRDLDVADDLLRRALEQDPEFVKAWELRAAMQMVMVGYGYTTRPPAEHDRLGLAYAKEALARDPDSAMALAARANIRFLSTFAVRERHDIATSIRDLERSIAIDPHDTSARNWLGMILSAVGRMDQALAVFSGCVDIDPLFAPCVENEYDALDSVGRYDEAYAKFLAALERGAVNSQYYNVAVLAHHQQRTAFMLAINQSNWLPGWRRHREVYDAFQNLEGDHRALAADLVAFVGDSLEDRPYLADLLIPLGAYELRSSSPQVLWASHFAAYRRSPQFKQFIRDIGVLDYWRAHGFPPQCRKLGAEDFACD
jgi:TolB-like protein/Tfp pilus assembly protein PilF